jgi:hypothetical protein
VDGTDTLDDIAMAASSRPPAARSLNLGWRMSDTTQQTPEAGKTPEPAPAKEVEPTAEELLACTKDAHDWVTKRNDDGDFYETCSHCGKQADWLPQSVAPTS